MEGNYRVVPIIIRGVAFRMRINSNCPTDRQLDCAEEDKLLFKVQGKEILVQLPEEIKEVLLPRSTFPDKKRMVRAHLRDHWPWDEDCFFTLKIDEKGGAKLEFQKRVESGCP